MGLQFTPSLEVYFEMQVRYLKTAQILCKGEYLSAQDTSLI